MTRKPLEPFELVLDVGSGRLEPHTSHIERRASELRAAFKDSAALEALVQSGDPVMYEVFQYDVPEETGQLICCTTVLHPGSVGDEYFMTKGHYHRVRDTAEIYLGLGGQGYVLLMTEDGASSARPLTAGSVAYVPPFWAHRAVNVGKVPLTFFAVYPGQAGHDYATVEQTGFVQRVFRSPKGPVLR